MKVRTDIVHHDLFSPFIDAEKGREVARRLKARLDGGNAVYTVSVQFPERVVLDQLSLLYEPGRTPDETESTSTDSRETASTDAYLSRFPGVRFERIVLFEEQDIWIYRMTPKEVRR
jgi:hypothetical protein